MAPPRCPSCTEPGTLSCTRCKNVKYCSLSCQQTDWQFHKVLCKSFPDFETRPSDNVRRVIYFPADQAKPEFKWAPIADLGYVQVINFNAIGIEVLTTERFIIHNKLVGALLDAPIHLAYDINSTSKYSETNKAAKVATNAKMGYQWRGPLVAYCERLGADHEGGKKDLITDMDMQNYSDLVAFLVQHLGVFQVHPLQEKPKVKAVKTNCIGEQDLNKVPYAQTIEIPRMHPIFDKGAISAISKNIGIPLLFTKDARKKYSDKINNYCNERVSYMHMACDPNSETFGWAPPNWQGEQPSNVLIARMDCEPLDPDIVEAFGDFCQWHLTAYFQWQHESVNDSASDVAVCKGVVLGQMTPENWSEYLKQWRNNRSGSVSDLADGIAQMALDKAGSRAVERSLFDGGWPSRAAEES